MTIGRVEVGHPEPKNKKMGQTGWSVNLQGTHCVTRQQNRMADISDLPRTGQRFLTTVRFARDPFTCYRHWKKKFGETFLVNALNGDVVVLCNRDDIRKLFSASFQDVAPFAVETVAPLVGTRSIFLIQGELHRRERALLSPPFHGQSLRRTAPEIVRIALHAASKWKAGQIFRVMDSALDVSLEVIIQIVFGVQSRGLIEKFIAATKSFVGSFHPILAFTRLLHRPLLGLSPWNKFVAERNSFYQLLRDEIRKQRKTGGSEGSILAQLISTQYDDGSPIDEEVVCDQLVSMLFAGHETTQIAIAWAMSWLHRYPVFLHRLQEQLREQSSVVEILDNELLDGICFESLRLNSIVSDTIRKIVVPMSFGDVDLPAGSNIAIPICLVHEDANLYPDPFKFDPDRWRNQHFKPHEFMPFGGGVRRCIGAPLALMELKLVVATWIKHFQFQLPQNVEEFEPTYRRNITMAPKSGIPLVFVGPRKETANVPIKF